MTDRCRWMKKIYRKQKSVITMATFEKKNIVYYLSPVIRENKAGRREKHYHILCGRFTDVSGYTWLQVIGTSKEIEKDTNNVIIVDPSVCGIFTKKTRFNCDRVYPIAEKDMRGAVIKGVVPDSVFEGIQKAVGTSEKVKPIYKKRMGIQTEH